ncbi:MAG: ABC transporter [Candidatus Omnitrophica bacterium CG11_big_fil_rev_8_21_14_0_20_45_26]|uniref:ABC transporter n=1 Tax=Candidatus Abzuiibacterium crystallinum TaxID=1974748 RepID=A0A2H0LRT6_9BACT|nr:MAG: ABC transporter [Candidatus Omnitrophica bacterium CG11_big_fil_rev_8_21_14_0_20_45_26]
MKRFLIASLLVLMGFAGQVQANDPVKIKIQGSTTVNPVVTEAAEIMAKEKGWKILVDTQGGSSGGISALGDGLVNIGMISRPVSDEDREKYPEVDFTPHRIGLDGVALIVSKLIWESGVHAVTREQVQDLYEGRIKNWKELGGSDAPVVFYNKEPGRGTWEVFADWAYGSHKKAPFVSLPEVGANEEARSKVAGHPSAISQLSFAWAEKADRIKALSIRLSDGETVEANRQNIQSGKYPLTRPLFVVTDGEPEGEIKDFINFLKSDLGQRLVKKHGYLSISE